MIEMGDLEKQVKESNEKMEMIIKELKDKIKQQFWLIKGYDKTATNNLIIVDEGIEFGIDAMRKTS